MHNALREQVRQAEGRSAQPSAALVDSQSVRGADTAGATSRGYDAGKKINVREKHVVTDTTGLLLAVLVTGAGVQDRQQPAGAQQCRPVRRRPSDRRCW